MSADLTTGLPAGRKRLRGRGTVRGAMTKLCRAWTAYTLRRAIADVASTSEHDYRQFGLDKADILAALRRLRDEIEDDQAIATRPSHRAVPLAIVITRRERRPIASR